MKKNDAHLEELHHLHYAAIKVIKMLETLRKELGKSTNPFINVADEAGNKYIHDDHVSQQLIDNWKSLYNNSLKGVFQRIKTFSKAIEKFEENPNVHKSGAQLLLEFNKEVIKANLDEIHGYLSDETNKMTPHISGRAQTNQLN